MKVVVLASGLGTRIFEEKMECTGKHGLVV